MKSAARASARSPARETVVLPIPGISVSASHRAAAGDGEHLAAIALETGRPKDKARLLQFLESRTFDTARFDALVVCHRLGDKWARFKAQFLEDGP